MTTPTREQIAVIIDDLSNPSVEEIEAAADEILALFSQPSPSTDRDCTCGFGGVHDPANPRCERNGYRWTEPSPSTPSAESVAQSAELTTEMDQEVRIVTNADNSMAWVYFDHGIALNRTEMLAFANALLEAAGVPGAPPIDQDPVMRLLEETRLSEPPHIEDMAPGTTFTAAPRGERAYWWDGYSVHRSHDGLLLGPEDIHLSTITDVTPPPALPEAGR